MGKECKIIQLRPQKQVEREKRVYQEPAVKRIIFHFARDLERKRGLSPWRADKLRKYIETVFDFD